MYKWMSNLPKYVIKYHYEDGQNSNVQYNNFISGPLKILNYMSINFISKNNYRK